MIDAPVQTIHVAPEKIVEVLETFDQDEFGLFLENDSELQNAYLACLTAAGIEWTDEEAAEAAFRHMYGDRIGDLMQAWRFRQELNTGDRKAMAIHIAVLKYLRRQKTAQQ